MHGAGGVEADAEAWAIRQLEPAVDRYRLIEQQRSEHRNHLVSFGCHHQEFREGATLAGYYEMVTVHSRGVRNDQDASALREG